MKNIHELSLSAYDLSFEMISSCLTSDVQRLAVNYKLYRLLLHANVGKQNTSSVTQIMMIHFENGYHYLWFIYSANQDWSDMSPSVIPSKLKKK